MTKWEYKIIDSADTPKSSMATHSAFKLTPGPESREAQQDYLNALGAEGWEIIALHFFEDDGGFIGAAKRER